MLDYLKQHNLARSKELREKGVAATTISRALAEGKVIRVDRGLYQLPDSEADINANLVEVCKKVPKANICLMSALAFHELTDQIPRKVWIAIGTSHYQPSLTYPKTKVVRFREPYYSQGIEEYKITGVAVPIYSVEKSICDAFRHPKLVDRSVAIECLKSALNARKSTPAKIADAAKKYRAWNQINPYLEAITSNG